MIHKIRTITLASLLFATGIGPLVAQILEVKDSEGHGQLVNGGTNTSLVLSVGVIDSHLVAKSNCDVRVELHNSGYRIEVVYMPALIMWPAFRPSKPARFPDEYGIPMLYGRGAAKDEALNYVVLMPGDFYGRVYRWTVPTPGSVSFQATYHNTNSGALATLPAWCGELRKSTESLQIDLK